MKVSALTSEIDAAYSSCFSGLSVEVPLPNNTAIEDSVTVRTFPDMDEATWAALGRTEPEVSAN